MDISCFGLVAGRVNLFSLCSCSIYIGVKEHRNPWYCDNKSHEMVCFCLFFKLFCAGAWALSSSSRIRLGWENGGTYVSCKQKAFMVGFYLLVLCYMSYVASQMGTLLLCFDVYVEVEPGISNWTNFAEGVSVHESRCASQWSIFSGEAGSYNTTLAAGIWGKSVACNGPEIENSCCEVYRKRKYFVHELCYKY